MASLRIKGKVFSGFGQGAYFTQLEWVKKQCKEKLGFVPYPGTLNLTVEGRSLEEVKKLRLKGGIMLTPPTPDFCEANCVLARISHIRVAIVFPRAERFTDKAYPENVIEILAPVNLKETLSLKNGDYITLEVENERVY